MATMPDQLTAPYVFQYKYRRSTGPVLGRFLAGLRECRIFGVRASDGRVLVPPVEADPDTGAPLSELVEVAASGVVTSWAWLATPRRFQPLERPFAWALIRLNGADTPLVHAVDAENPERMSTGMSVRARWRDERVGSIRDLACFEPDLGVQPALVPSGAPPPEPLRR